jgi:hypothetical protein
MRSEYPKEFKQQGPANEPTGQYLIPHPTIRNYFFVVIFSDGEGWEHLSVTIRKLISERKRLLKLVERTPTWSEMCWLKDMFWSPEECVVQFHPPAVEHVSNHDYCLHLWRPINEPFAPLPPSILVGSQTLDLLFNSIRAINSEMSKEEIFDAILIYASDNKLKELPREQEAAKQLAQTILEKISQPSL